MPDDYLFPKDDLPQSADMLTEPAVDRQADIKETQPDYETLRKTIETRYKICKRAYSKWMKSAKEDMAFWLGDQWTDEEREALRDQNRPCLTFNRIKPIINLISGHQRENSPRLKVSPEGGEDKIFSEVIDTITTYLDKRGKLDHKINFMFDDGAAVGRGYIEAYLDYTKDPQYGELKWRLLTPYEVMFDPEGKDYDPNEDCDYMFKTVKMTRGKLKQMFPGKEELIDSMRITRSEFVDGEPLQEGDADNYHLGKEEEQDEVPEDSITALGDDTPILLREYWYKSPIKKFGVVDGQTRKLNIVRQEQEATDIVARQQGIGQVLPLDGEEMRVAFYANGEVLDDRQSTFEPLYSGYTVFRFLANYAPSADNEDVRAQGVTRQLKDAQREKNKAHSQFLHILNTQANSGWIGDEDALSAEGWKRLEQLGSIPGITIRKRAGKELTEIQPKAPNMGQIMRERAADDEFKQITGINPDLLGIQDATASGKAIGMRIRQGLVSLAHMVNNFRQTKQQIGCFMLDIMPMIIPPERAVKIVGPAYMRSAGITEGQIAAYLVMIKDHYYDVDISENMSNPTLRAETLESLTQLMQTPQGGLIPIELIIDYMNIPNSEDVKAKIAQTRQQAMVAQQQQQAGKGGV